jgi:hypothetical protein
MRYFPSREHAVKRGVIRALAFDVNRAVEAIRSLRGMLMKNGHLLAAIVYSFWIAVFHRPRTQQRMRRSQK